MAATIDAVVNDGLSKNQAADNFEVSRTTLKNRLSGRVTHEVNPGLKPYLTKDEEWELADHLLKAASIAYGKTRRDVCQLLSRDLSLAKGGPKWCTLFISHQMTKTAYYLPHKDTTFEFAWDNSSPTNRKPVLQNNIVQSHF